MAEEIERRFLVHQERLPELPAGDRYVQGYLSDDPHIRFRVVNGGVVILCVKTEIAPGRRTEIEFRRDDMSVEEVNQLSAMALAPPLAKTRHRIAHEGLIWEIDVYEDENEGLVTADVELPSSGHPIQFPDWIDPNDEISGAERYANVNLTRRPFKQWADGAA